MPARGTVPARKAASACGALLVTARDQHGVDLVVLQNLFVLQWHTTRRTVARNSCREHPPPNKPTQPHAREFLEIGKVLPLGQIARPDQRELELLLARPTPAVAILRTGANAATGSGAVAAGYSSSTARLPEPASITVSYALGASSSA